MEASAQESGAIEVEIRTTEEDHVQAFVAHAKKTTAGTRKLLVIVFVISALVIALAWPLPIGLWVLLLPSLLLGYVLGPQQPRFFARRAFRLQHPGWRDVRVVLDETHVRTESDKVESYRPWKQIADWLETPELIVLVTGGAVCDILPKRAFEPGQLEATRALLDRKLHLERAAAATSTPAHERKVSTGKRALWVIVILLLVAAYSLWRAGQ